MMKMRFLCILPVAVGLLAVSAQAKFRGPSPAPVERLLKNAETYLAAHADSAEARYIVARIHYLAFARASASVPAISEADDTGKPVIPDNWMIGPVHTDELGEKELAAHATAALTGFHDLLKKEPANALYQLGLASLLEQIADWKDHAKPAAPLTGLKELDRTQARATYLVAYRLAFADDAKLQRQPLSGLPGLVSYEAGNAFLRLAEKEAAQPKPLAELKAALAEVKAGLTKISSIPMGPITPIVFAQHPAGRLADLLAPETTVDFDLRGYGPAERWAWVRPDTALLVWDPARSGEITSGQQLFGGYTFQLFRANGYDALAALDDNGDGVHTGAELAGIRVWFDANGDGKSSPDEVRDLADLGIVGIAVRATGQDGLHPTNPNGLILRDGGTLPTWDWTTEPVKR